MKLSYVLLIPVLALSLGSQVIEAQKLAVVSRGDDKVAFISLETGKITGTVSTGSFPHEIVRDLNSCFAYVPSYGGNRISKIDIKTGRVIKNFEIKGHRGFHSATIMNNSVWVTSEENKVVLEVDPENGEVKKEWPTRGYRSHMIVSLAIKNKLYVANMDSGSVSIINVLDDRLKVIKTGSGTEGIDVSPSGHQVWVSNRGENTISIIDTESDTVTKKFGSEGDFPVKLKFNPNGNEVWIANNRSGTVSVFDSKTYSLKKKIEVGNRPLGITFSDNGKFGYVTKPGTNEVLEIDISNGYNIVRSIRTLSSPDGIVWFE